VPLLPPFTFENVVAALNYPPDEGRMILREVCGVSKPDGATLGEMEIVLLALYLFVLRKVTPESLTAFRICQQVRQSGDLVKRLRAIRVAYEKGQGNAKIHDALVLVYEDRFARWFGGDKFYDLATGEMVGTLEQPPAHYVAWDAATMLVRILRAMEEGAKQDAKPTATSSRSPDQS